MNDRFKFRIPMFTDKDSFMEFQYIELGEEIECTLCGYNKEPQQCTGLKDKNGTLIYEGDIVKFKNFDNKYNIGTIKYTDEDALFCLSYINENNRQDWDYVSKYRLEVIGNKFENPELIKE